ncbi:hypothetical protein LSAT2_016938 [Lamellibrachia satsuma]|nr:hypothetical protein LSAT2_016938 [Lamellibrachia satsuma]
MPHVGLTCRSRCHIDATRDFYQTPSEFDYDANVSCMTTGPSCVRSCAGRNGGNFQSCTSCSKYISCSSHGGMLLEMPCPAGSKWDNLAKTCRKRSRTCIPCAAKSKSWFKDKHAGYSLPGNKYFTAGVTQQVYRFPGRLARWPANCMASWQAGRLAGGLQAGKLAGRQAGGLQAGRQAGRLGGGWLWLRPLNG